MKFVIGKKGLCVSVSLMMLIPLAFAFCMFPVKDVIVMVIAVAILVALVWFGIYEKDKISG